MGDPEPTITEPTMAELVGIHTLATAGVNILDLTDNEHKEAVAALKKFQNWVSRLLTMSADEKIALACSAVTEISTEACVEIETILTVSTSHIEESTSALLTADETPDLIVFEKGDYGHTIYVALVEIEQGVNVWPSNFKALPPDLKLVMAYAVSLKCSWLCFDRDGPINPTLPTYDW